MQARPSLASDPNFRVRKTELSDIDKASLGFGLWRDTALGKGTCTGGLGTGGRGHYLLGSRFNALVPLALLHIQVQSSHHIHTHQLWIN